MQSGFYSMLSAQAVPTVALGCWHLGHSHQAWPALKTVMCQQCALFC